MYSITKTSLAIIAASISLLSTMSIAAEGHNYQNAEVAKSALRVHQGQPSSASDPLIDASKFYITLPPVDTDVPINNKSDFILKTAEVFTERRDTQKASIEVLANTLKSAINAGDKEAITQAYDDYHHTSRDGNLVEMIAIEEKQESIAKLNTRAFFDSNNGKSVQYRQSTDNFINTYRDDLQERRERLYGDNHASRVGNLNAIAGRVTPVFEIAGNFSDECSACELEVPPVNVEVTPPIPPTPSPPVVRPPVQCGGWEYDWRQGRWVNYLCP